jgi:hypothetical protein
MATRYSASTATGPRLRAASAKLKTSLIHRVLTSLALIVGVSNLLAMFRKRYASLGLASQRETQVYCARDWVNSQKCNGRRI